MWTPLRLRFLLVSLLLRGAAAWAAIFVSRVRGESLASGDYATIDAKEKFGLSGAFSYTTIKHLPRLERYPWRVRVAKTLVVAALRIPLVSPERWRSARELALWTRWLPTPRLVAGADPGLGRLSVQGPNAIWIRRWEDSAGLPAGVWMVDYLDLLRGVSTPEGRWLVPCAAIFDAELGTVGIMLEVDGRREWFVDDGSPRWRLARMFFGAADLFVHEAVSHLLWTHLHAEAVILAAAQHLPLGHAVRRLFGPHFAFTLQANENSGRVLLGTGGVFDRAFAAGWTGAAELFARGDVAWRFSRMIPSEDVEERGVAALSEYPWRDDALTLWAPVHLYAQRVVARTWTSEDAIAMDSPLQAWSNAMVARFGAGGWPPCRDRESLARVLAACLFLNVRHTLVNAQQYDMYGYPPAWPAILRVGPPMAGQAVAEETLIEALPDRGQTLDTIRATFAFSIQYNRLGVAGGDEEFRAGLHAAAAVIAAREAERATPYRISLPDAVSGSINA